MSEAGKTRIVVREEDKYVGKLARVCKVHAYNAVFLMSQSQLDGCFWMTSSCLTVQITYVASRNLGPTQIPITQCELLDDLKSFCYSPSLLLDYIDTL